MSVKIRNRDEKTSEQFINEMADKPYGIDDRIERITICLNGELFDKIDEIVRKRKRAKLENRTVSAFLREIIEQAILNGKN
jgi:hypothetical protein